MNLTWPYAFERVLELHMKIRLILVASLMGYVVSGISYHSSIKNLHTNGRLQIDLEIQETSRTRQYRVLTTELEATVLQKALNDQGVNGFRLLAQTPIPLELGFIRPRDMFLTPAQVR